MSTDTHLIFAYGSNLHIGRMRSRVPSAEPISIGYVAGRRIAFHKRSNDGSAKADASYTADPNDRVWGVIYRVHARETPILDRHEFLGIGYDRNQIGVVTPLGTTVTAWMYVARSDAIDRSIRPYFWYLEFIVTGAHQHRLPLCYIKSLRSTECDNDPDPSRYEMNHRMMSKEQRS